MNVQGKPTRTITAGRDAVEIIDQTALPHAFVVRPLRALADVAHAIASMQVRGAPLIGATAAYGIWLAMRADPSDGALADARARLLATRPTAVNLRWALDAVTARLAPLPPDARAAAARAAADAIADEDVAINRAIGRHALPLIRDAAARRGRPPGEPIQVLTHCNAGWLATVDWGTALAGVYAAHDAGVPVHVWVDETRPRNQGAALTAWELGAHGVPHTVIVDNAGGHLMQRGQVDVGSRRHGPDDGGGRRRQQDRHLPEGARGARLRRPVLRRGALPVDRLDNRRRRRRRRRRGRRHPDRGALARRGDHRRGRDGGGRQRARARRTGGQPRAQPGLRRHARAPRHRHHHRARRRARVARGAGGAVPRARRGSPRGRREGRAVTDARGRRALAETVRWLMARGLYAGTSGNVSARAAGGLLITPSGVPCDDVDAASIVAMTFDGAARGALAPSTEWRIHRDIYRRRPDVGAVVHTHSTFATALSCLRRPIPAFHYMVAKAGGDDIRCARYATYGTAALSRNALAALGGGRRACLLANHGLLALGADLAAARLLAEELEALCAQLVYARAAGKPVTLPAREMTRVRAKFATYGRRQSE